MANPWFRLYSEFATDPKVQTMTEVMQRRLIMVMCLRCSNELGTLHETEIAFHLRISEDELQATKTLFIEKGFLTAGWKVRNWDKRQFASDSSTARVRRHREKRGNVTVTKRNVAVTPPEQNRTEQIQNREDQKLGEKKEKVKRGVRLADGWMPDNELITWAREHAPGLLMIELPKFIDYWRAQPGQRGIKLDWSATFRNWLRKAHNDRGITHGTRQPRTDRKLSAVEQVEQAIRDGMQRQADFIESTAVVIDG